MADLTSTADVKTYLGVTHSTDDTLIGRLVSAASQWFEAQTGRVFSSTSYDEVQDGCGGRVIVPSYYPLISITSLKVDGVAITASTAYGVDGYYIDGDVIRLRGHYVSTGIGNVELAYVAGYSATPKDVAQAVIEMASLMYRERTRVGQQTATISGESVNFYYAPPARVVAAVEAYRRAL